MSLEDKIIKPMAPAELPAQRSDPLPKKRRKGGGTAAAKVKNGDLEDEVGGDNTAVLTLGAGDQPRRPQKKMLFESASDAATLSFAGPIRRETPRAPVVPPAVAPAPAAKAPKPVPAEPAPAPVAAMPAAKTEEIAPLAPVEAQAIETNPAPEAPAPKSENKDAAAIAALRAPVFQVSALAMREPDPQPQREPKDEAQVELALTVESTDDVAEAAQAVAEPAADTHEEEESLDESLTLAFDATLADGLAERTAAAQEELESTPAAPAPEPVLRTPEPPPAAIETVSRAERQPAPPAVEPQPTPSPAYVAPVAEAPKVEPKPESVTPSRGLSRSEAIAARLSARATPRPVPAAGTLAAARTAQQQLRSADLPKNPGDIYGYWTRVKNGRRFPSRADFDPEQVAENWPNSMLLTCGNGIGAGTHGNFSSVLRLGANRRTRPGEDLSFTSMITEWILATGGEAARAGAPVQDTEVFPTPDGTHAYKIVALPLSENQTRVDHVLCHLSRS